MGEAGKPRTPSVVTFCPDGQLRRLSLLCGRSLSAAPAISTSLRAEKRSKFHRQLLQVASQRPADMRPLNPKPTGPAAVCVSSWSFHFHATDPTHAFHVERVLLRALEAKLGGVAASPGDTWCSRLNRLCVLDSVSIVA
jgi:hypothetical protein